MRIPGHKLKLAAIPALLMASTGANAQIEEITVTAQKREQSLNEVPISISAFDQDKLNDANLTDVSAAIKYTPGVTGAGAGVASTTWRVRGIGTIDWNVSSEPAVAVFMDDAYIGRNTIASTSFFDLERVEVLRGPQGTLFGRNASAGAINLVTRKPEFATTAELGIALGNEGQQRYRFIGNVADEGKAAFRLAYQGSEWEGIQTNTVNGADMTRNDTSFRLSGLFTPVDSLEILVSLHQTEYETTLPLSHNVDLATLLDLPGAGENVPTEMGNDSPAFETTEAKGANLRINWDINDSMTLTSITDWRDWDYRYDVDVDAIGIFFPIDLEPALPGAIVANGPAAFDQNPQFGDNLSQEFRPERQH